MQTTAPEDTVITSLAARLAEDRHRDLIVAATTARRVRTARLARRAQRQASRHPGTSEC